jgi:low affinity Fe/Cu permease
MEWFSTAAHWTAVQCGRPWAFIGSVAIVVLWFLSGPLFGWSDTWQLVVNTATTVITFWMVFLLQHTQNRDTLAMHTKLDELIAANRAASNAIIGIEKLTEEEIEFLNQRRAGKRRRPPPAPPHMRPFP